MPDNATIITARLKTNKGKYFCHACVSAATGVTPSAQVNQIIRPLGQSTDSGI
jgi:hypothetical protein